MRKARRETNLFVAEGASVLVTAREAGWAPRMLVFLAGSAQAGVAPGRLAWAGAAGAAGPGGSQGVLAQPAPQDNPPTPLGVFEQRWAAEPPSFPRRRESTQVSVGDRSAGVGPRLRAGGASSTRRGDEVVWVALEAVRDPGNLGTILRTADAVGASGVIL